MLSYVSQFIFGTSNIFSRHRGASAASAWKDKSLCFDIHPSELEVDSGEKLIGSFFPIEDIKGNPDQLGLLKVTNLRLIWICCSKKRRVNLSIGWRTVSLTFEQKLRDSLGSRMSSLCVLTKYESTKYEFIFNKMFSSDEHEQMNAVSKLQTLLREDKSISVSHLTPNYIHDPFEVVFRVWQSYNRTNLFRHCRANLTQLVPLEGSGSCKNSINKLPSEQIIDMYEKVVQMETRSIKHEGTLIISNVRLVWLDDAIAIRNFSIPFIRIESVKFKQPDRLLISTCDYLATTNQLEFRPSKVSGSKQQISASSIFEQVNNLFCLYKSKPKFGPECCEENIEVMAQLKPLEYYSLMLDDLPLKSQMMPANFGPEPNMSFAAEDADQSHVARSEQIEANHNSMIRFDSLVEQNNSELINYRLNNYLNEPPNGLQNELIYSTDLAMTVERPAKDADLQRIWQLEM